MTVFNFPDTTGQPIDGSFTWTAPSGVLYVWNGDAWVTQGGGGSGGGGEASISVTDDLTTIADPKEGDLAYHSVEARLYVYYQDDDSQQWVDASPAGDADEGGGGGGGASVTVSDAPPLNAGAGDLWWDSSEAGNSNGGRLYIRYEDDNSLQWVQTSNVGGSGSGGGGGGTTVNYNGASAWVSTEADGTIKGSFNVASVTKTGTGTYEVVFTTPMPNSTYSVNATCSGNGDHSVGIRDVLTTGFTVKTTKNDSNTANDKGFCFAVHSTNAIAPQSGVGADAWGDISLDGTLNGGFNIASVNRQSPGVYDITFTTAMPTSIYSVVGSVTGNSSFVFSSSNHTTSGFTAQMSRENIEDKNFKFVVHASSTVTPTYTWTRNGTTLETANAGDGVDVAGNITIGSNAGTYKLGVYDTGKPQARFQDSGGTGLITFVGNVNGETIIRSRNNTNNGPIVFEGNNGTTGTEYARFNPDGSASLGDNLTLDPGVSRGSNKLSIFAGSTPQIFSPNNATINILSNSDGTKGVTLPFNATSFSPIGSHSSYKDIVGSVDEEQCWSLIRDIKLKRYYYKDQPRRERLAAVPYVGPMADWLGAQDPELVMTAHVAAGDKQTYNQGLLEMKALQALSTALTRIEALEAKIQQLEGGN